jgi:hypothetical protein
MYSIIDPKVAYFMWATFFVISTTAQAATADLRMTAKLVYNCSTPEYAAKWCELQGACCEDIEPAAGEPEQVWPDVQHEVYEGETSFPIDTLVFE